MITGVIHLSTRLQRRDQNGDGFMDVPIGKQVGFVHRWKWTNNSGQEGQIGTRISYLDNIGGQTDYRQGISDRSRVWGFDMANSRVELWAKRGFVNLDKPYRSVGFQFNTSYHDQKSQFGLRRYDATQKSAYFNAIYQDIISNTDHQIRVGGSTQWDQFSEEVAGVHYYRHEIVPGIFGEYTYKSTEKFTLLLGGRIDYHNNYGFFYTPRINLRYAPTSTSVIRISGGRGQRTASIFAENIGVLATARNIVVRSEVSDRPYGLNPEIAWNFGTSFTQDFKLNDRDFFFSIDAHRVQFENQIVIDYENARQISFYNLVGQSFSNSIQTLMEGSVAPWLTIRLAYRYNDVRTTYGDALQRKPLISPHRAFVNLEVKLGQGWAWDYTINWLSSTRIPSTAVNPELYLLATNSPSYYLSNTQVSKKWKNNFEAYLGAENIFNYHMHRPILGSEQPYGTYFDSSLAWGPIMGINTYVGVRYNIQSTTAADRVK
jgi:outer membrane receptor for ferrienterochelin and colicins